MKKYRLYTNKVGYQSLWVCKPDGVHWKCLKSTSKTEEKNPCELDSLDTWIYPGVRSAVEFEANSLEEALERVFVEIL